VWLSLARAPLVDRNAEAVSMVPPRRRSRRFREEEFRIDFIDGILTSSICDRPAGLIGLVRYSSNLRTIDTKQETPGLIEDFVTGWLVEWGVVHRVTKFGKCVVHSSSGTALIAEGAVFGNAVPWVVGELFREI
jgi:hypothetical protein